MDLLAMDLLDKRRKAKFTVLRRQNGTWSSSEISMLVKGLQAEIGSHPRHPEYLVIPGHYTKEAISRIIGDKPSYTVTQVTGVGSKELPFIPS